LKILVFLSFLLPFIGNTTNRYVSNKGNDGSSGTISSPYLTIAKAIVVAESGDSILLRRGDTFTEAYTIEWNKNEKVIFYLDGKDNIHFGAYGNGRKPVVTSLKYASGWVSIGGNKYTTKLTGVEGQLNILYIDDLEVPVPVARLPKLSNPLNGGWLTVDVAVNKHGGAGTIGNTIQDNDMPSFNNLDGAGVIARKNQWIINYSPIIAYDARKKIITYTKTSGYDSNDGWGYAIANHPECITQNKEWSFNQSTGVLTVQFDDGKPEKHTVAYASLRRLTWLLNSNGCSFNNIRFKGATDYGISSQSSSNCKIDNCEFDGLGVKAIAENPSGATNFTITNNYIHHTYMGGIDLGDQAANSYIGHNTLTNIATYPGAGKFFIATNNQPESNIMQAIQLQGDHSTVEYNNVKRIGYIGIQYSTKLMTVQYNKVDSFCLVSQDGGAFYSYFAGDTSIKNTGLKVSYNIASNSFGNPYGTNDTTFYEVYGIYADDNNRNATFSHNTIKNITGYGFVLHNSKNCTFSNNVLYNCTVGFRANFDNESAIRLRGNSVTNNTIAALTSDQKIYELRSVLFDFALMGTFNNNTFIRPRGDANFFHVTASHPAINKNFTLAQLQSTYGLERNSIVGFKGLQSSMIEIVTGTTILNGNYQDVSGGKYTKSITLPPYSSAVLLKTDGAVEKQQAKGTN
jgi:parallel beta-helix repeat protein